VSPLFSTTCCPGSWSPSARTMRVHIVRVMLEALQYVGTLYVSWITNTCACSGASAAQLHPGATASIDRSCSSPSCMMATVKVRPPCNKWHTCSPCLRDRHGPPTDHLAIFVWSQPCVILHTLRLRNQEIASQESGNQGQSTTQWDQSTVLATFQGLSCLHVDGDQVRHAGDIQLWAANETRPMSNQRRSRRLCSSDAAVIHCSCQVFNMGIGGGAAVSGLHCVDRATNHTRTAWSPWPARYCTCNLSNCFFHHTMIAVTILPQSSLCPEATPDFRPST
jgi:hypothetical protein